ncbi:MAG: UDP-N-acetylmuramate--L-alanine ligase [Eubacteriales bacterium]
MHSSGNISLSEYDNIFFSGIGGISMSSVALIMRSQGHKVWGSDIASSPNTDRLEREGIEVLYGHSADNVRDAELLVFNSRIKEDNPEIVEARRRGIPIVPRALVIGLLMEKNKSPIGFSGTHGKSTTTAMAGQVFISAALDPTILNGAEYSPIGGAYRIGQGDQFIFEADEYTNSFHYFLPKIAVILGVEMDHPDFFRDIDAMTSSFAKYASLTGRDGYAVVNADSPHAIEAVKDYAGTLYTYSLYDKRADFCADNIRYNRGYPEYDVYFRKEFFAHASLRVPGEHNVANSLSVCAAGHICGLSPEQIKRGLYDFTGIHRRFEYRGEINGAVIADDYAHHPTEIAATLTAARRMGYDRIICLYQPHTYSRTKGLFGDFVTSLSLADITVLADIFTATEKDTYGVSSADLAKNIDGALYFDSFVKIADFVRGTAGKGDLVITMGAGDIYKVGDMLIKNKN